MRLMADHADLLSLCAIYLCFTIMMIMQATTMRCSLFLSTALVMSLSNVAQGWVTRPTTTTAPQQLSFSSASSPFPRTDIKYSDLTGEILGEKYLLCKDSIGESTSAKSFLYKAYPRDEYTGQPFGDQVVIKVSDNHDALRRETLNYNKLSYTHRFVDIKEYIEPAATCHDGECKCMILKDDKGALVMECGKTDLKSYIQVKGALAGQELQTVARSAVECLHAMHERNLVWTELKSENLVVTSDGSVKGIDVESAVPIRNHPIDFTPKQCPPEFAEGFLCGREPFMEMDTSFDIWSIGMLLYELATGRHYFAAQEHCHVTVCMELKNTKGIHLDAVRSPLLRDLIGGCLHLDPARRPAIHDVLWHPYFGAAPSTSLSY